MVGHNKTFESYLASRTNVIVRHWNGIPIVIYDDHRWLLNVLYAMQKYNYEIPNLIFFDAHDDYGSVNLNGADLLKKMEVNKWDEVDERKFLDFVEFEADPDDGNWLRIACELDMVNDVALIGGEESSSIYQDTIHKSSLSGKDHRIYKFSQDLNSLYDHGGKFDSGSWEVGYQIPQFFSMEKGQPDTNTMAPYIVDFDLDYFSIQIVDKYRIPWSQATFDYMYSKYDIGFNFIMSLLVNAKVITICREPAYCGGLGNAHQILWLLDNNFFNSELGTTPAI